MQKILSSLSCLAPWLVRHDDWWWPGKFHSSHIHIPALWMLKVATWAVVWNRNPVSFSQASPDSDHSISMCWSLCSSSLNGLYMHSYIIIDFVTRWLFWASCTLSMQTFHHPLRKQIKTKKKRKKKQKNVNSNKKSKQSSVGTCICSILQLAMSAENWMI